MADPILLFALLVSMAGGALVGFSLALIGGGGSILATPFLAYVIGLSPHMAIGTSAVGVGANAAIGLYGKARDGAVSWQAGIPFALAGVVGAIGGAAAGKATDGDLLLGLFAILMIVVGAVMLRKKEVPPSDEGFAKPRLANLLLYGGATGLLAGFFGIGGGFLIVPGLIAAASLPIFNAMATSLVGVTALGATTASSYAFSGLVHWPVAAAFIAGGFGGSWIGGRLAKRLAGTKGALTKIFSGVIFAVAAYMLYRWGLTLGMAG